MFVFRRATAQSRQTAGIRGGLPKHRRPMLDALEGSFNGVSIGSSREHSCTLSSVRDYTSVRLWCGPWCGVAPRGLYTTYAWQTIGDAPLRFTEQGSGCSVRWSSAVCSRCERPVGGAFDQPRPSQSFKTRASALPALEASCTASRHLVSDQCRHHIWTQDCISTLFMTIRDIFRA